MASYQRIDARCTTTACGETAVGSLAGGGRRIRLRRRRLVGLLIAVCALTLAFAAGSAQALQFPVSTFGSSGSGDGQFQTPAGVAIDQANGLVYVADSANARVEMFNASGQFILAFGWGVTDGKAQAEICTSNCQAGIPGSGPGQFSKPTTVAVDSSGGPSNFDVYVGDSGNNVVEKFNFLGGFISTIDGSTSTQGKFTSVAGVSVDQSGNLWTADGSTNNIVEFDPTGTFLQQWNDGFGQTVAIAVDSTNAKVYLIRGAGTTESFNLTGGNDTQVDNNSRGTALAVDPATGNLYVDQGSSVDVFSSGGTQTDTFSLTTSSSVGLAFGSTAADLYVSDQSANNVTLYAPPTTPAAPVVQGESGMETGTSSASVSAQVFPFGLDTTCQVQFVDDATFQASGYTNATSVPCVPADLGSSITAFQSASADLTGLTSLTTYHFRFVAMNVDGTTNGADTTFETAGAPAVSSNAATAVTDVGATLNATVTPNGLDATCIFQYVDDATFNATGYASAKTAPCSPSDLGSGFAGQSASATITGLTPGTTYHFRAEATNSAGTTDGPDTTLQTHISFLTSVSTFGGTGAAGGQFQSPVGVGVTQSTGNVYVTDTGNARVEKFSAAGKFAAAWGWGVRDGKAHLEVCTTAPVCEAGIAGSGAGQFSNPASIAVDSSSSSSAGDVYVGDANNNVVSKFDPAGHLLAVINGGGTPQGPFQALAGVAVDQSGNLWTVDRSTDNVDEFSPTGAFVQQWNDTHGSPGGIAVDSVDGKVYLLDFSTTDSFTLNGTFQKSIDNGGPTGAGGTALSLDPSTGNLYVDHGSDVAMYDHTGTPIDHLWSLGATTSSQGLAFRAQGGGKGSRLYISDAGNNNVGIYGPRSAGAPFISNESATQTGKTTATLNAAIVTFASNGTCTFQFVDDATFQQSGYSNATSVRCSPANLGSSFTYQTASANLSGLSVNTTYHFRVISTNAKGTTTGVDQTFEQTFAWAPFDRCPVDDPAMLATDGGTTALAFCIASNSPNGSITIGNTTETTGNTNLQTGQILNESTGAFTGVSPSGGALVSDPVQIPNTPVGAVTAVTESAGTPSNFSLLAGISVGQPIITIPIKIHLENATLGPSCFLGSDQSPILLNPENLVAVSFANAMFFTFDPSGAIDPNGPIQAIEVNGATQGDNTFSVPGASGCGPNGDGSLNAAVNAVLGLPSPSGANHLVLNDASSDLAAEPNVSGQQFAHDWHVGFG
jgi:DNA-binding beta-propeller fold protein YncE